MAQSQREELKVMAERALLVGVALPGHDIDERDPLGELRALAKTAGAEVVGEMFQRRAKPSGRTFLGKGKVEELNSLIKMTSASLVVFDNELSPAQVRNIEKETSCKIVDRSELILDIFANRASTAAAKLQVEIAQLEYTYPRLRAMWDHLGQVTGGAPLGIGTRGPGEQQLEIDRRLVQNRLVRLKRELEEVQERSTRDVATRNHQHFTVGLVGYTNAGKSTLFNRLTAGGAFANPKLFATLATRIERWDLGGGNAAMLSDTVGFIRNLPHHLVASFRSTLEETIAAKLLLVVLDVSDPRAAMQRRTVNETLDEIGATTQPRLLLLNKVDQFDDPKALAGWQDKNPEALAISAVSGEGLDAVRRRVLERFLGGVHDVRIELPMGDTRAIMFLEQRAEVLDREYEDGNAIFSVRIGRRQLDGLLALGSPFSINAQKPHEAIAELWPEEKVEAPRRVRPHEIHVGEGSV